ncbi:MAG: KH domain-containing protein [Candidatus Diapherotrites archaeon]|nr:KH domain-containing protein [Candidatus Diapherotrites archaeon]
MEEIIKIPEERVGVLIGPKGSVKRKIQAKTKTKLEVDSPSGEVIVSGEGESYFKAHDIVKAIGRGFSPERAFTLLKDDYLLKVVDIAEFAGKNPSNQKAKKGRVIGKEGFARIEIEKKTHCLVSVYGKTIAIIGLADEIESAISAVEMLLEGAKHETMEHFLHGGRRERFEL